MTSNLQTINDELAAGAVLVDVREPDEYATGHAVGAINLPLSEINQGSDGGLEKNTKIYLYCRSGARAETALGILREKGFADLINLGGLSDWQTMGGEVENR